MASLLSAAAAHTIIGEWRPTVHGFTSKEVVRTHNALQGKNTHKIST